MKVLFLPEVVDQFLDLAAILYEKGYFGFKDEAIHYSESLFQDIHNRLPIKVKKGAPAYYARYGKDLFYSAFRKNKRTIWYVFYSVHQVADETVYLVRHLTNNHIAARHVG